MYYNVITVKSSDKSENGVNPLILLLAKKNNKKQISMAVLNIFFVIAAGGYKKSYIQ